MNSRVGTSFVLGVFALALAARLEAAAPTIVNQPKIDPVVAGDIAYSNGYATGTEPLSYQWQKDGVNIPGATSRQLSIRSAAVSDSGNYRYVVSNAEGTATSASWPLVVYPPETGPRITVPLKDVVVTEGGTARFESTYAGPGIVRWYWGTSTPATTLSYTTDESVLEVPNVSRAVHGASPWYVRAWVTLPTGNYMLHQQAMIHVLPPGGTVGRLRGSAHRGEVGNGSDTMITGIIIQGSTPGRVLIRGIGPAMAGMFPAGTAIVDPELELFDITGARVATNDNWDSSAASDINAASLSLGLTPFPAGAKDAALLVDLPAGNYTVHLRDRTGVRGIGLVELYDVNPGDPSRRIVASATRAKVSPGNGALIQGFFVDGSTPRTFMIRGLGPKLAEFGVTNAHPDPRLELYVPNPPLFYLPPYNDSWGGGATDELIESLSWRRWMFRRIGLPPLTLDGKDATLIITLQPGAYTVQLRAGQFSPADSTGVALLEMYEMP